MWLLEEKKDNYHYNDDEHPRVFLEYTYGRTRNRWEDYVKDWNLRVKSLRTLLNNKLEEELQARQNWPMYAFVGEDLKLRKKDTWSVIS
mgnify:CR=1 FL=1